jgi:hypothetical protein
MFFDQVSDNIVLISFLSPVVGLGGGFRFLVNRNGLSCAVWFKSHRMFTVPNITSRLSTSETCGPEVVSTSDWAFSRITTSNTKIHLKEGVLTNPNRKGRMTWDVGCNYNRNHS